MRLFFLTLLLAPLFAQAPVDIPALQEAAEAGDTKAQLKLAHAYEDGNGVPRNDALSIQWLRRAAESGNPDAQNSLGVAYRMGRGVPKDFKQAVAWYRKAARKGSANAMYNLGTVYFNGEGELINDEMALVWFKLAEKAGAEGAAEAAQRVTASLGPTRLEDAVLKLGEMYQKGQEIAPNDAEALKVYLSLPDSPAVEMRIAEVYNLGRGVPKDVTEAVRWCLRAAKADYPPGLYCVAYALHYGVGAQRDFKLAAKYYEKAGQGGIPKAFDQLGLLHNSGALGKADRETALLYFLLAQSMGVETAKAEADLLLQQLPAKNVEKVRKKALQYWSGNHAVVMFKR